VAFDPLDGSSIIGSNFSVGSIFGVMKGRGFVGRSGKDMVGAAYAVYGPRTVLVVAYDRREAGGDCRRVVKEFVLVDGVFVFDSERKLGREGKVFAPANLRAGKRNAKYGDMMGYWMSNGYTLRYTGGMVPDIHNLLVNGGGVFCNPVSDQAPAKLRLLYECLPFAFVVESAGGTATQAEGRRVLDAVVEHHDTRIPICLGSAEEVALTSALFVTEDDGGV
jgi:sedoheptulose-bisphosphatase